MHKKERNLQLQTEMIDSDNILISKYSLIKKLDNILLLVETRIGSINTFFADIKKVLEKDNNESTKKKTNLIH